MTTDGLTLEAALQNGSFTIRSMPDGAVVPFRAETTVDFFLADVDAQVRFTRDTSGAAVALTVHQFGRDRPARKLR